MGVTGLWKLIEPCGQPVPVEMLESKVLAVDISIWLHQVIKGFQDNNGSALANSHLLGLFHRLCKLMYYRIKPVFVFDGKVPALKKETIAKRIVKRNKLINEADRIQNLLLQSLAKEKVVQQALGSKASAELLKASPSQNRAIQKRPDIDDMFKLPDLPYIKETSEASDFNTSSETSCSDTDSSLDSKPQHHYNENLQAIDVKSKYFRNLPADIRHEILVDIKETRKQSSWGKLHELPSKSNDFSLFQMKRLLKRRQVQESLEEAEKEMDGVRTFTLSELENIFSEDGIIEPSTLPNTKHISSDANTRFLLVRDLKKTLATAKAEPEFVGEKPETSALALAKRNTLNKEEECALGEEYDDDLQTAIQMSLDESALYRESDYEYSTMLKLNKEQRMNLKNSAVGPSRAYMIEHGGLNDEDVNCLLKHTQTFSDREFNSTITQKVSAANEEVGVISDLSSDSELETCDNNRSNAQCNTNLEIFVDPSKMSCHDDLFSDVFSSTTTENKFEPKQSSNLTKLLQNLKKQASKVIKINLTNIENDPSIIEISDDESVGSSRNAIYDSIASVSNSQSSQKEISVSVDISEEESQRLKYSLDKDICEDLKNQPLQTTKLNLKDTSLNFKNNTDSGEIIEIIDDSKSTNISSTFHTPSKTKSISEFFETKYAVKRTPEKPIESIEDVPNVKSPFFIKKTPGSGNKKSQRRRNTTSDEDCPQKKKKLTSRMLFVKTAENEYDVKQNTVEIVANVLKDNKTHEELEDLASCLAKEKIDLEMERNRQERMGMTITERMNSECMQLLRLFGVPFIVAPMEAEAQCAFLDAMDLTNGTITDDSDIWLFGGQTVYKNFFAQNKHVMEFKSDKIKNSFNVDRKKLIQLALLVGSDYTTGVHGIGAVTALEILANFSTNEANDAIMHQQTAAVLTALRNFRNWWANTKSSSAIGNTTRHRLRNKLKNIELGEGFPSPAVVEAYLTPTVDSSQESFSWGSPDVESIREFTRKNFGWTRLKTDETLGPVLKKNSEKKFQSTIKNYFAVKSVLSSKQMAVSKRVQNAINKMSVDYKSDEEKNEGQAPTCLKPGKGKHSAACTHTKERKKVIPKKTACKASTSSDIIPQRESYKEEMERKKELAAIELKKSKLTKSKK